MRTKEYMMCIRNFLKTFVCGEKMPFLLKLYIF